MGFLDKAKAAANDLAAKADTAMANSGLGGPGGGQQPDKLFRDLGVLAFLDATGRPAPEGERERIVGTLREVEQRGGIPSFALQTAVPPPGSVPPPPGAAAQMGQQAPQAAPPAPSMAPPPPGAPVPEAPVAPTAPPPPPPSWARTEE